MNGKIVNIIIGVVAVVLIGGVVYAQKNKDMETATDTVPQEQETSMEVQNTAEDSDVMVEATFHDDDDDDDEWDDDEGEYMESSGSTAQTTTQTPTTTAEPTPTPTQSSGITLSDVAQNNSRSSCWSVVNGGVYDLTSWIPQHPGGEKRILNMCGIDASGDFNRQHGKSSKVSLILSGFKIGTLSQ